MSDIDKLVLNGTIYNLSDSEARSGLNDLKSALSDLQNEDNRLRIDTITRDAYIDTDGSIITAGGWFYTDYIAVPWFAKGVTCRNFVVLGSQQQQYRMINQWIATYDKNKAFTGMLVSNVNLPLGYEHRDLQWNVKYIRVVGRLDFTNLDDACAIFDHDRITKSSYNVFFSVDRNDGGGVIGNDGQSFAHDWFGHTDFIPVPKWANRVITYNRVTLDGQDYMMNDYRFATYDENQNFIENIHWDSNDLYVITAVDPTVVKYIKVDYGILNIDDNVCIFLFDQGTPADHWSGKTGDFLGDSLTEGNHFIQYLVSDYGIVANRYGKSGTTISNVNPNNTFQTRIAGMSTTCDFVFVLGGTNDWGLGAILGDKDDTTEDTFYGGLYLVLSQLRAKFPLKPIFVSTIPQRNWQTSEQYPQASGIDSNKNGDSVMDFNEAIVYMAHRYGCVVVDAFGESGICVSNISTYANDNLHFNAAGSERLATYIKDVMETISPYN